jgi:hypothetical protein
LARSLLLFLQAVTGEGKMHQNETSRRATDRRESFLAQMLLALLLSFVTATSLMTLLVSA